MKYAIFLHYIASITPSTHSLNIFEIGLKHLKRLLIQIRPWESPYITGPPYTKAETGKNIGLTACVERKWNNWYVWGAGRILRSETTRRRRAWSLLLVLLLRSLWFIIFCNNSLYLHSKLIKLNFFLTVESFILVSTCIIFWCLLNCSSWSFFNCCCCCWSCVAAATTAAVRLWLVACADWLDCDWIWA